MLIPSADTAICVVTRIEFGTWRHTLRALIKFYRLRLLARRTAEGFVSAQLSLEGDRTIMLVSLWRCDADAIAYRLVTDHLRALRWSIDSGAKVWSRPFDLRGTSSMSKTWLEPAERWVPAAFGGLRADGNRTAAATCVITRITFRRFVSALRAWPKFRALRRLGRSGIPGFASATFSDGMALEV